MPDPGRARSKWAARTAALASLAVSFGIVPRPAPAALIRDNLYDVRALDAREAWAVGNFGAIYHTADGGQTWQKRESGTKSPLFGVDFAGPEDGWAVGKSALILHTADGGATWTRQANPISSQKPLFKVKALDARTAWTVGDWGAVAVTHDGGATWEDRSLADDVVLYDISFPDARHGFVAGEYGTLLVTDDGGTTWTKRPVGTEKTLFGVSFSSPTQGWVVGIDGLVLRTRDGGATWDVQRGSVEAGSIEELGFLEALKNPGLYAVQVAGRYGVVIGDTGMVLTTADGGETWTRRELPGKQQLVWMRGVSLAAGPEGFVVGASGFTARVEQDRIVLPAGGEAAAAP